MELKLDTLLGQLGNPGKYQICLFLLVALNYFPVVFNHIIMAFFGSIPPHDCVNDEKEKLLELKNISIRDVTYGKCLSVYHYSNGTNVTLNCEEDNGLSWRFKPEPRETTIVTDWNLVCENAYLGKLATTIYFCGVMVGGLLCGYLADKFGRRPVMFASLYIPVLIGVGTSFANSYPLFVSLRFFQGICMQGLQTTTYAWSMELALPQYRGLAGAILECYWGVGVVITGGIAYLVRSWRYIQLAIALPSVLTFVYIWFVPESLRWLIMVNRMEDAKLLIQKISKFNNLPFPEETVEHLKSQFKSQMDQPSRHYTTFDLLRTPQIRKRSVVLFYIWFAVAVSYYGLTFKMTSLAGNKYLNFIISGCVELLAYIITVFTIKRFGRRKLLVFYFLVGAVACIVAGCIPFFDKSKTATLVTTGFAIVGKFGMGGVFSVLLLYTTELYPTVIRSIGFGGCAFWARVGGVVAPQVLILGDLTIKSVSVIVIGVLACIGTGLVLFLPETLGKTLADTIEDAENEANKYKEEKKYKEENTKL